MRYRRGQKAPINSGECSVHGCSKYAEVSGMCMPHYRRTKKFGTSELRAAPNGEPWRWIMEHANHSGDTCLAWPFGSGRGYHSVMREGGGYTNAHRAMCEAAHGSPSALGLQARHKCGNSACVNPQHLEWGTPKQNTEDRYRDGTVLMGEKAPWAKLTRDDVCAIRARRSAGEALDDIARDYPCGKSNIWAVATGKTWRHA